MNDLIERAILLMTADAMWEYSLSEALPSAQPDISAPDWDEDPLFI